MGREPSFSADRPQSGKQLATGDEDIGVSEPCVTPDRDYAVLRRGEAVVVPEEGDGPRYRGLHRDPHTREETRTIGCPRIEGVVIDVIGVEPPVHPDEAQPPVRVGGDPGEELIGGGGFVAY